MRRSRNLGPLEREIMESIWDTKKITVREVHSSLKKKRDVAYTTVMTVMGRLVDKGFLTRKKQGKAYLYFPKKTKTQTAKSEIKRIVKSLIEQYGKEAVTAFTDELSERR